jgi:hypothetical protein
MLHAVRQLARKVDAKDERVRSTIGLVPALLDQIDELIAKGVIGGQEPNAATMR